MPVILFAVFLSATGSAQAQHLPMKDITDSMNLLYPQIKTEWGKNKTMPAAVGKQIFFALSYFPELKKTKIHFRMEPGAGIISTRPSWGSVFRRSSKRTYIVAIGDSGTDRSFSVWAKGPANGQVGIMCHELCHILYFRRHTGLGLIGLGINHISTKYMDGFENKTDSVDVERGLGWQLIDWNLYLHGLFRRHQPDGVPALPPPPPKIRERYMSPASIKKMMEQRPIYRATLAG